MSDRSHSWWCLGGPLCLCGAERVKIRYLIVVAMLAGSIESSCDDPRTDPVILVPSVVSSNMAAPRAVSAPSAQQDAWTAACTNLKRLGCAEVYACDPKLCTSHVRLWCNEGAECMPDSWCPNMIAGLAARKECVAAARTSTDVTACGFRCRYDCVIPPCADIP
jgi:hypothetical protein